MLKVPQAFRPLRRSGISVKVVMAVTTAPPATQQHVEQALKQLQARKQAWKDTPIKRKIQLLKVSPKL